MAVDTEELSPPKKTRMPLALGEDLSAMSEHELVERIAYLDAEIARCRDAIQTRRISKSSAEAIFRKA